MEKKLQIYVENVGKNVSLSHADSLLESLLAAGVEISHSCGGNASCGTCQIKIAPGSPQLPAPEGMELEMAQDRGFAPDERLACQIQAIDGLKISF